jgi:putative flippase GtrA
MGLWKFCLDIGRRLGEPHQTKIRFLVVGLLNTAVGLAVYPLLYILTNPLKLHYLTILVVSQVICVSFSFLTSKFLVFRTSGNYLRESLKFLMFHSTLFMVNLVALPVMVEFGGMNPIWAQMLFTAILVVISYFWHSRITFPSSDVELGTKFGGMLELVIPERKEK